jgi:hypothetical protein
MPNEVRNFSAVVGVGSTPAAPQIIDLTMPPRIVTAVRWRVPRGALGQMGFALGVAGVPLIPAGDGQWIIADDESDEIQLTDQPSSGAWQLIAYNTGIYPHTVYVTFQLQVLNSDVTVVQTLVPLLIVPAASTAPAVLGQISTQPVPIAVVN